MQSVIHPRGPVTFPAFMGERIHMRGFLKSEGLPKDLQRWQKTVDAMLDGIEVEGLVYLMVDQGEVRAGTTQRRSGVHVDGCWNPLLSAHTGVTGADAEMPVETLLLASDVLGCRAYAGTYEGWPAEGGDCSHIDVSGLAAVDLTPGRVWAGHTLTMLHESLPVPQDCLRTVVRLNVPGWQPH